jgi:hypothetical protein
VNLDLWLTLDCFPLLARKKGATLEVKNIETSG